MALALAGLLFLIGWPPIGWNLFITGICAAAVLALDWWVEHVWHPFPDPLGLPILFWNWVLLSGIALLIAHLIRKRWLAGIAAVIVLIGSLVGINYTYGYFPDVGTALGLKEPTLTALPTGHNEVVETPAGGYVSDVWSAQPPLSGTLSTLDIPGSASGFKARPGFIYLPPGYLVSPRPVLPVLVLLSGQPGAPQMWIDGGQITETMDSFAAAHQGLAPIVLLPDVLGSDFANTLCVDSSRGNVESYLAQDIPAWVAANLQAAAGPASWAIGGLSFGGTCALQLALRRPDVYGRFLDLSGDRELELRSKRDAVDAVFGGDLAVYAQHNPPDLLARQRFPQTAARLVVGTNDTICLAGMRQLTGELRAAGADVSTLELPGAHSWSVWRPGLAQSLPWLAAHTALVRP
jgi:enterochelin esterase-like enzyme